MNEAETRAYHIDPALASAGWGTAEGSRIRREYRITLGRLEGHGRRAKPLVADYVLEYRNTKLAVVEAKAYDEGLTEGVGQAKNYADKLAVRFAYATNGQAIYGIDMQEGREGELSQFPTPDELWDRTFAETNAWRDRFAAVPFEDRGGYYQSRYYQDIAVERVMAAIAGGKERILLTLATGTGKTFIAFQIAWKLFHSRWNLDREPNRRPRILFLADRNLLADQAYNAFSAFPEDALVRIAPDEIRKKGKVPKNGSLFFTIFQTFMSGGSTSSPTGHGETSSPTGHGETNSPTGHGETGSPTSSTSSLASLPSSLASLPGSPTGHVEPFQEVRDIVDAKGYMYILECGDGSYYTGSTVNLAMRVEQHRSGEGAKHTARHLPVKLVYYEAYDRISEAFAREKQVQGWSRAKKIALIQGDTRLLQELSKSPVSAEPIESAVGALVKPAVGELVEPAEAYGEYPPDFFDFIVVDECHRGGAHDESDWRGILDYFAPAVQLGLTATPKRRDNVDTYAYFGEPVFVYSLREGINDGYLTPFRVKQIATTLDEYVYTGDDWVMEGEVQYDRRYEEKDFNKILEIKEREAHRVKLLLEQIRPDEKTLVFCATQDHALVVRDLINQMAESKNPNYCQRVTANDGDLGEQHLRDFQDNEKAIPTILTTSQKLSTGVDARNIRNIVLMRPVNSMIEFKQIIGRGTRIYDGKDYFTIYDFVKAHHHFQDPEWDGEPVPDDKCKRCGFYPCQCEKTPPAPCPVCGERPCICEKPVCPVCLQRPCVCKKKAKVKLADGKERTIQHMMSTTFWHPDGRPMSAQQFMEMLFGKLPEFFKDEEELRALWSAPDTRRRLLDALAEKGFGHDQLAEMQKIIDAEKSDLFDVLAHVAYAMAPLTREDRAHRASAAIHERFASKQQTFLEFVLAHYVSVGVEELDLEKLTPLLKLRYHDSIADAVADLGPPEGIHQAFRGFQKYLYERQEA